MDYRPVSFLSVVSTTFEKLVINIQDFWLLEKCDFSPVPSIYGSHAYILNAISDRIARAFIKSGIAQHLAYPKLSTDSVILFVHLGHMEFNVEFLDLFCHFW